MHKFTLPSGIDIELREMTGAEEEILTNQRLIKNGEAINRVLLNCISHLGDEEKVSMDAVLALLSGDRLFALVKLRQISLGDEVELQPTCPNNGCRMSNFMTVDLEELEISPYPEEREFAFKLPSSGKMVKFGFLDGHKEKRLASLKEPNISSAMLIRIIDIDGKPPSKKILAEMSMRDRNSLRQEMARVDGGIDTMVELECDGCGAPIRTRLEAESAFLFPGVRL